MIIGQGKKSPFLSIYLYPLQQYCSPPTTLAICIRSMCNGPSIKVTDHPLVIVVHYHNVALFISLFESKLLLILSLFILISTKETFTIPSTLRLSNNFFLPIYLSGTNFKIAKMCTRETFNFVETAKINTRQKS